MADIKDLSVFNNARGLDKIKNRQKKKEEKKEHEKTEEVSRVTPKVEKTRKKRVKQNKVGAPLKNHDRVYTASSAIKVSALLNSISRLMTEKYLTEYTRDEVLRKALDEYIRSTLTQEDKKALLQDIEVELALFRKKNPTVPELDENNQVIKSVDEIEKETLKTIADRWQVK